MDRHAAAVHAAQNDPILLLFMFVVAGLPIFGTAGYVLWLLAKDLWESFLLWRYRRRLFAWVR